MITLHVAGWSSPVAREAHNLEVAGSNPAPATNPIGTCGFLRSFAESNELHSKNRFKSSFSVLHRIHYGVK